ncbi:MAG: Rab family GTPase [Promethearchaeota archaeon]
MRRFWRTRSKERPSVEGDSERQKSYVLKVVLLGDAAVGRRTLIQRFIGYDFFEEGYYRLTGTSFGVCQLEFGDALVAIQLWMLGSEPWFQSLRQSHYRGSVGAIFVFSVTSRTSFERIPSLAKEVLRTQGTIPTVLVGTKIDLKGERVISKDEGQDLARELGAYYLETSTSNDQNILAMFQHLVEVIIKPEGPPRTLVRIPLAVAPSHQEQPYRETPIPSRVTHPSEERSVADELASLSKRKLPQEEFDERVEKVLEQIGVERDDLIYDYLRSLSAAGHREAVLHRLRSLQEERSSVSEMAAPVEKARTGFEEPVSEQEAELDKLDDAEIARLSDEEFDALVARTLKKHALENHQEMVEYLQSLSAAGHREIVLYKLRNL